MKPEDRDQIVPLNIMVPPVHPAGTPLESGGLQRGRRLFLSATEERSRLHPISTLPPSQNGGKAPLKRGQNFSREDQKLFREDQNLSGEDRKVVREDQKLFREDQKYAFFGAAPKNAVGSRQ